MSLHLAAVRVASLRPMALLLVMSLASRGQAQGVPVLQLDAQDAFGGALPADGGVAGLRRRLLELRTTASVLQVTAHPDDEQSGVLTLLARGTGARTALLTLTRGEAGANAVGSELFDGLGLLRTEELLLADRYYGLDDQYFTSAADYGFSKTMREAAHSWDTTAVLADMVRVIRQNQPLVVIARWYGGARDGHGHHQLAGALAPLAVVAAADSTRFREQLTTEGLTPWRVQRLFRANVRAGERAEVVLDPGRYDPWLGETYQSIGADGLSRQRSQTAGRRSSSDGAAPQRWQQLHGTPVASADDPFSGIDTSLPALFALVGESASAAVRAQLQVADAASRAALASMDPQAPWSVTSQLLTGLRAVRAAQRATRTSAPHALQLLAIKEEQFQRAIVAALALQLRAIAGTGNEDGHPLVPGERTAVQLTITQASPRAVTVARVELLTPAAWRASLATAQPLAALVRGTPWRDSLAVTVPVTAEPTRPAFVRDGVFQNHYRWRDGALHHAARADPPLRVRVTFRIAGEAVLVERAVRMRQSNEPEDVTYPRAVIVPPVSLRILPQVAVVAESGDATRKITVEVTGNSAPPVDAVVGVELSPRSIPIARQTVRVARGMKATVSFDVQLPRDADSLVVRAAADVGGRVWRDELTVIAHRELEPAYLYAEPVARIRRVPVSIAPGLRVAYVMGVGDLVPDAISQLGATVTLLDAAAVSAGDFSRFDAVVVGTRAYAVRAELPAATPALLTYARGGGNVVVLYQTQEFRPETMAPFPAALPDDAEETTEEDAPVRILAPEHPLLTTPNRITERDFDGWIEQRGSKFLTRLSPEYTALVETHDGEQEPQTGVWISARVGDGRWSYVALALHRQLPYAIPGAFRILANLLSRSARR
ncbi:MAG: PIG-L family deacetylase [Gemmatimonadota bacterium]